MTETKRISWVTAAVFAAVFDIVLLVLGWLLIARPRTFEPILSFKTTITIGLPSAIQVLEANHQPAQLNLTGMQPGPLLWAFVMLVILSLANAYYIALLARSVETPEDSPRDGAALDGLTRDDVSATRSDTTAWQDARRSFPTLLAWMLFQMVLTLVAALLLSILGVVGGFLAIAFFLWFRYYFLFFEYSVVVLRLSFSEAWETSKRFRTASNGAALSYFLRVLVINLFFAFLINYFFSPPMLFASPLLIAFVLTLLQRDLMNTFRRLASADGMAYTGRSDIS